MKGIYRGIGSLKAQRVWWAREEEQKVARQRQKQIREGGIGEVKHRYNVTPDQEKKSSQQKKVDDYVAVKLGEVPAVAGQFAIDIWSEQKS